MSITDKLDKLTKSLSTINQIKQDIRTKLSIAEDIPFTDFIEHIKEGETESGAYDVNEDFVGLINSLHTISGRDLLIQATEITDINLELDSINNRLGSI
jgi:hypothetical protein